MTLSTCLIEICYILNIRCFSKINGYERCELMAVVLLGMAVILAGCGASKTVKGAGIGIGAGGALGAGIGAIAGNTGLGAVLGAAVGGTAGALIGKKWISRNRRSRKVFLM